ncbi:ABC transporter ATP-binding protein [Arenimonas sp.]|uniref:ABC transporter ATP-binding protein n=1 Tax=Arenimonas sp. TaxID=1872635 RepID=UPI0035B3FAAC
MSTPLVEVRGLSKRYPVLGHRGDRLAALWDVVRGRPARRHASVLEDITFSVMPGESLAIIGENGAGKSTLLKLVTGVLTPTSGSVRTRGRIGALLELGAGFHPELSGRDNVRLAAALHGLDARALAEKLPEIEAFADIGDYLDEPVKHYSSGMVVRLGFAVIATVRPALLVTDEVLAVGDEAFQRKCIRWLDDYLAGGGTLLLVSHSLYHVRKLCRRALWLHGGKLQAHGDVFEVSQAYEAAQAAKSAVEVADEAAGQPRLPGEISLEGFRVQGEDGDGPVTLGQGETLDCELVLHSRDGRAPVAMLGLAHADGTPLYGVTSEMEGVAPQSLGDGRFSFRIRFDALPLLPGRYRLKAGALDAEGLRLFDQRERDLVVRGESREFGVVRLPHRWGNP